MARNASKPDPHGKPSEFEFTAAVSVLCELIPFAPNSELAQEVIAQILAPEISTRAQLDRLVRVGARDCSRWEGVAGLLQAFRRDSNQAAIDRASLETEQRIEQWKREVGALPPADRVENQKLLDQVSSLAEHKRLN